MAAMQPEFPDESPINPFDFWEGANFRLKIRKVDGYWNYDKSEFEKPSKLDEDDNKIEEICTFYTTEIIELPNNLRENVYLVTFLLLISAIRAITS